MSDNLPIWTSGPAPENKPPKPPKVRVEKATPTGFRPKKVKRVQIKPTIEDAPSNWFWLDGCEDVRE